MTAIRDHDDIWDSRFHGLRPDRLPRPGLPGRANSLPTVKPPAAAATGYYEEELAKKNAAKEPGSSGHPRPSQVAPDALAATRGLRRPTISPASPHPQNPHARAARESRASCDPSPAPTLAIGGFPR